MVRKGTRTLSKAVAASFPELEDAREAITQGQIAVDGLTVTNPASVVGPGSTISVRTSTVLRGEAKLRAAFIAFGVTARDRIALDVGASTGGFTRVLLADSAARVYAVDAGYGQLLGSLRQDPRVVNLEATNLADLTPNLVPDPIQLFTIDLSYLSLTDAAPQLDTVPRSDTCDLIALVKPMFELHLSQPPTNRNELEDALHRACLGLEAAGWKVMASIESPVTGARGAVEFLVYARRQSEHPA